MYLGMVLILVNLTLLWRRTMLLLLYLLWLMVLILLGDLYLRNGLFLDNSLMVLIVRGVLLRLWLYFLDISFLRLLRILDCR